MFRKVSFYPPDLRPLSSFHWPNEKSSKRWPIFSQLRRNEDRMSERERERKGKKKKKEFDVRSAHPARGTRDAIVLESERERRSNDWIWPKLTRWKIGSNQRFTKKKKRKSREGCKIFSRRKEEYYEGIIFGKISHAIILSKESVSGGEFVYRLEPFSLGRAADTIKTLSTSCATRLRARSSYYVSDTRISRTNQPAKANQKGIRSSSLTIN